MRKTSVVKKRAINEKLPPPMVPNMSILIQVNKVLGMLPCTAKPPCPRRATLAINDGPYCFSHACKQFARVLVKLSKSHPIPIA